METPRPVDRDAATAAYQQIRAYFKGQDDPDVPVPTTMEGAVKAVTVHRRWCDEELLAAALTLNAWIDVCIAEVLREHDARTLALLDACQSGDWNRLSYARIGRILGLTRQGAEQFRLRLRQAVADEPRAAHLARKRPAQRR